ncbi:hypothetical protein, unknown function [Leishmania mexicana MHOM/GT/2001/U1103]|uniref:Uncharacterized protein n=1 Tax=Leishmania mexicana (strain MHOM/GT/2001/U1103) TaxID=929439 RepID=E9B222_LEIMU|nr:hypothetical protein, unknown function [Leishmania mexicana MHOM/GT/2001/U1103]CBZ29279.1 hypothetical protein, unknown function [Leishmania mexicana MHOM/GT/2001/U1103]
MLQKLSALWKVSRESICQPDATPSTTGDGAPPHTPDSSPKPCARSATTARDQQNNPLCVPSDRSTIRSHRTADAQRVESSDFSPSSVPGRPISSKATGDAGQRTGLPSISGAPLLSRSPAQQKQSIKALSASPTRSGSHTPFLASPSQRPRMTSPLAPLGQGQQRLPRANAKAPLGPPTATASTPKTAGNEGCVGIYTMPRRLTANLAHTLDSCVMYGTLYDNSGTEVNESSPQPHPSEPPYSMLQCRTLAVLQPSHALKGASEPAPDTVPRRRTESDSVDNNASVHEPEVEKNFHEAMLYLSRFMSGTRNETTGAMSDGAGGTAIRGGRANRSGLLRTLRSSRHASDATSDPANSSSAKNCDSSEASGFSRLDFASLFATPSYDLRCDEPTGMYNGTAFNQPVGQSAGVFSLAGTTSDFATPPVSMTSRVASKIKQNEGSSSNARLGRHVEDTATEASESVSVHPKKMEEDMEESVCSQTAGTAVLRRVNDLALSQWKYIALVANKVMERKTLVRASRALSQRVSSVSGALELNVLPNNQLQEASAGGANRNGSFLLDATTESRYIFDSDDDEVSVYDADGRPLLIPNMSDLWDDFRSSNSSDESLVFGEADAFTADDGAAHAGKEGESELCATRPPSPSETRRFPDTSHDQQAPPSYAAPAPPAAPAQRQRRQPVPHNGSVKGSWGGRCYDYSNGNTNLYPAYQRHPDPRTQEQMRRQRIMQQQRQQLFQEQQRRHHFHSLTAGYEKHTQPQPHPYAHHRQGRSGSRRGCPSSSAKMPWPQPDIYSGPKVYTGQSKFVDFTALSGIRLSDVKRVNSPCWNSIKLADEMER